MLLEAHEVIVRAPFRRTLAIADLSRVDVVGGSLRLRVGSLAIALELGEAVAEKWAKRIATPPPSLARKLGIGHAAPAFVIGTIDEPALLEVLAGHTAPAEEAKLSIAAPVDAAALERVIAAHRESAPATALWIVHGKGAKAAFGETPVRALLRARGYRDIKVSAVSDTRSATCYAPPRT